MIPTTSNDGKNEKNNKNQACYSLTTPHHTTSTKLKRLNNNNIKLKYVGKYYLRYKSKLFPLTTTASVVELEHTCEVIRTGARELLQQTWASQPQQLWLCSKLVIVTSVQITDWIQTHNVEWYKEASSRVWELNNELSKNNRAAIWTTGARLLRCFDSISFFSHYKTVTNGLPVSLVQRLSVCLPWLWSICSTI